jgi:hypothetical protein
VHGVAGGGEHGERSVEILTFEVAVEGVGEEDDLSFFPSPACGGGTRAQRARRG